MSTLPQVQLVVVDDDPAFQQLVGSVCAEVGVSCRVHRKIADFQQDLAAAHADIAVIDGLLPDGSGIDVAKQLSAQPQPRPRVIFASAIFKKFQVFKELRAAGVEHVLTKPVEPAALAAILAAMRDEILAARPAPVIPIDHAAPKPAAPPPAAVKATPRDTTREDAARAMAALRAAYAQSFAAAAAELRRLLEMWRGGDEEARGALRHRVHRLAGTAGSFGFLHLSELAAEIDGDLADGATVVAVDKRVLRLAELLADGGGDDRRSAQKAAAAPIARLLVIAPSGWTVAAPAAEERIAVRIEPSELAVAAAAMFDPTHVAVAGAHAEVRRAAATVTQVRDRIGRRLPWACLAARDELAERAFAAEIGAPVFLAGDLAAVDIVAAVDASHRGGLGAASVLVVDDDHGVAGQVRELLEPVGIVVEAVDTPDAAWEMLQQHMPTLLLVDVSLPFYDGYQFCRMIKGDPDLRNVDIVMLSERMGVDERLAAFRAGAVDILVKPLVPEEFVLRIQRNLEQVQRYERDVLRDFLTRLPNRGAFEREVRHRLARMRRSSPGEIACGVLVFDIDHFKRINDSAGHLTGDRALQEFAGALEQTLRGGDFCARWGGEEFVVLTAGTSPEELRRLYSRVANALRSRPVFGPAGYEVVLSVSAGATQLMPEDDVGMALARADGALYRAKSEGRGCLRLG